ncbi:MAG: hypothetical protein ACREJO_13565 [Phycisphaerales bacterium]
MITSLHHWNSKQLAALGAITCGMSLAAMATVVLGGCATTTPGSSPYQTPTESDRNPLEAQRLTNQGVACMDSDPTAAEKLFRSALTADLYCGPAHNNLGALYLRWNSPRLYEAANELEWACKLMPGNPDPRMNLAMTMEEAGRSNEAIAGYRTALEVYPGYIPAVQALTSLQLRTEKPDDSLDANLREIALRGTTPQWREWAKVRLTFRADSGKQ